MRFAALVSNDLTFGVTPADALLDPIYAPVAPIPTVQPLKREVKPGIGSRAFGESVYRARFPSVLTTTKRPTTPLAPSHVSQLQLATWTHRWNPTSQTYFCRSQ